MAVKLRNTVTTIFLLIALAVAGVAAQERRENPFPLPAELEPDVNFWLSIFTQYSTREGVLHDNRFLAVVYESVPLPEKVSRRDHQREIDRAIAAHQRKK